MQTKKIDQMIMKMIQTLGKKASLDLDLTCWIILSAKFSMKSMKVKTTEVKKNSYGFTL